jgi:cytochrome c
MEMKMKTTPIALALMALSLGPMATAQADEPKVFDQIKIDAGEALFSAECRRCHSTNADRKSYGPLLEGVIGRQAGSVEGYPYSDALKTASFVWTKPALRAWIEDNQGFVPGTKMRHVGITDPVVQEFILSYLQSIMP